MTVFRVPQHSWKSPLCSSPAQNIAVVPSAREYKRMGFALRAPSLRQGDITGSLSTWCPAGPPRTFSAKLLSNWVVPSTYWWMGLFLSRCRTVPFASKGGSVGALPSHRCCTKSAASHSGSQGVPIGWGVCYSHPHHHLLAPKSLLLMVLVIGSSELRYQSGTVRSAKSGGCFVQGRFTTWTDFS